MPDNATTTELARARLDLPIPTQRRRGAAAAGVRAVEASIRADRGGALLVTLCAEPPSDAWTLPLLACLQFFGRLEEAVEEALTSSRAGVTRS